MALLAAGVPLTLLLDLVCGPRSDELLREEGRTAGGPESGTRDVASWAARGSASLR